MDSHNLFMTRTTYRAVRLEYAVAVAACVVLAVLHRGDIRWGVFVGLFAVVDVVGYLPGAIAWRRQPDHVIGRGYYVAYNVAHSLVTEAALAGLWSLVLGPEWALLALPIHLCGDRSVFGNFLKPFGLSFEPQTHPAYQELERRYGQSVVDHHEPDHLRAA